MQPFFIFALFFFFAIAYNLLGPLVTSIMETNNLTLSQSGLLVSLLQVGALISILLSLYLIKKLRQTTLLKIGYTVLVVALILIGLTSGNALLFFLYVAIGFGAFMIDSGSNGALSGDYFEKKELYIPLLHFSYSAGAIVTGYFILPFRGAAWRTAYVVAGIILALLLVLSQIIKPKEGAIAKAEAPIQTESNLPVLKSRNFILYTLALMLYMGSQQICATWIPVYTELELLQSPAIVGTSLTFFWVGIAISRLLSGLILQRGFKPLPLTLWGFLVAGGALALLPFASNIVLALILIALCGFAAGPAIPLYIVETSSWFPKNSAFIAMVYIIAGTMGRMIFPYLTTRLAESTSLGYALMVSSIMLFVAGVLVLIVKRSGRTERAPR
jgi:fucose permease